MKIVSETIPQIVAKTGVTHPNIGPYSDCSAVMVAWNEEERMASLIDLFHQWFTRTVIGVQESSDTTLAIAKSMARSDDQVIEEPHFGFGDASMPRLVNAVRTPWVFVVAADEWPSTDLLESLWSATAYAQQDHIDGIWIPFRSMTDGIEAPDTQAGHLRLFKRDLGWPSTMHSRPKTENDMWWPFGHILHTRSLDEMVRDYLRIWAIGKDSSQWRRHNELMLHDACVGVAAHKGWDYVKSHEWWPEVQGVAFGGHDPAL